MKIIIFMMLICSSVLLYAQKPVLPHYMTEKEKALLKTYQYPQVSIDKTNPPQYPVRTMAEWEELQGIMITWASFEDILSQIVNYAQEECLVYIVCSDSNSVKSYLTGVNVPLHNLKFIISSFNTLWCRDYGPWTTYSENGDTLGIVDWIYNRPRPDDDLIPQTFAGLINAPFYSTNQSPNNLIHTGGNFMVDGNGTGFSSKLILDENPGKTEADIDTIMKKYMGIKRFIKMDNLPFDEIHHIDMHMKLLDEETLLVGEYPSGVSDGPQIEANLQYVLNNFQTCYGRPFKVVRIPMPPDQYGNYPNNWGDYRTYTNSIIINKTVIIPTYELQYDTTAFRIYREAMPGYNIVGIESNSIIPSLGTIHCITKEIGAKNPIFISHAILENQIDTTQSYRIVTKIKTNSGVDTATVFWTTDTTNGFSELPLTKIQNDSFITNLPSQPADTKLYYYISATSNFGKTITKPMTAPQGFYQFKVNTIQSVYEDKNEILKSFVLKQNYPNPFNPETTIGYVLHKSGQVKLDIYNICGQKIQTLVNKKQRSGRYQEIWNGLNFKGVQVASGIYFYSLDFNGVKKINKMMLIR